MSARDTQARELPLGMGPGKAKDWDGSNVLGPCIATADEVDGTDLKLVLRINGEERTRARTSLMHHPFDDAHRLRLAGLHAASRRGARLGHVARRRGLESGRFLAPGDVVELEAEGIGVLRNRVGPRP